MIFKNIPNIVCFMLFNRNWIVNSPVIEGKKGPSVLWLVLFGELLKGQCEPL